MKKAQIKLIDPTGRTVPGTVITDYRPFMPGLRAHLLKDIAPADAAQWGHQVTGYTTPITDL